MLVQRLMDKQKAEGIGDREFAAKLGISGGAWSMVRNGKRELGSKALSGVARLYPDLNEDILRYLTRDVSEAVA